MLSVSISIVSEGTANVNEECRKMIVAIKLFI
jgi:hypothetical protein